jgi:predicted ATP-grasp superfamily ATP-dependent carboligase
MNKLITKNKDYVDYNIVTDCECGAHLLKITKYADESALTISHYSCNSHEVSSAKNLCWDVLLDKEKAVELAESILDMYHYK